MAVKTFGTEVLTSADTNTYLANSGLVYVKSQTVGTGVSTVTVTGAFSADYDNYRITWTGGTMSALGLVTVYMGASTGSGYYGARTSATVGGTFSGAGDNNTGLWNYVNAGNSSFTQTAFDLYNPFTAKPTHIDSMYQEPNAGSSVFGRFVGLLDNTTSYTSFTIDPQGAITMTGGTITVYGYRKA
jgi:hypothetical protein